MKPGRKPVPELRRAARSIRFSKDERAIIVRAVEVLNAIARGPAFGGFVRSAALERARFLIGAAEVGRVRAQAELELRGTADRPEQRELEAPARRKAVGA